MGFEPSIPASEQAKTVHASDRSATVTGGLIIYPTNISKIRKVIQEIKDVILVRSSLSPGNTDELADSVKN
jgi:hypothetical protein